MNNSNDTTSQQSSSVHPHQVTAAQSHRTKSVDDTNNELSLFFAHSVDQLSIQSPTYLDLFKNTPDSWIKRSSHMIELTGRHPYNAEPPAKLLMEYLITPTTLHYVRNHGTVPKLDINTHKLVIRTIDKQYQYTVHELLDKYSDCIDEFPIYMACDGNRRKELNMIKHSENFNWSIGGGGCSIWKGIRLAELLRKLDVDINNTAYHNKSMYIHFTGADELTNGRYGTSIPLAYVMDTTNDVLLATQQNGEILTPDHGYPIRVMLGGMVGGRAVKWLDSIEISDHESTNFYHIHDNTILPQSIDSQTKANMGHWYNKSQYKLYESYINSVITTPINEQLIDMTQQELLTVRGYAHNGNGVPVIDVEVSLDDGATWLQCNLEFPDNYRRYGFKTYSWCHWSIELPSYQLFQAPSIVCRAWDRQRQTQHRIPNWNLHGMGMNAWYIVKIHALKPNSIRFIHPVLQGNEPGML